jgi:putative Ca2+/H+ antiporter (TMEM165/GDT1 family)
VPVVLVGKAASARIPFKAIRISAALLFAGLGVYALVGEAVAG